LGTKNHPLLEVEATLLCIIWNSKIWSYNLKTAQIPSFHQTHTYTCGMSIESWMILIIMTVTVVETIHIGLLHLNESKAA